MAEAPPPADRQDDIEDGRQGAMGEDIEPTNDATFPEFGRIAIQNAIGAEEPDDYDPMPINRAGPAWTQTNVDAIFELKECFRVILGMTETTGWWPVCRGAEVEVGRLTQHQQRRLLLCSMALSARDKFGPDDENCIATVVLQLVAPLENYTNFQAWTEENIKRRSIATLMNNVIGVLQRACPTIQADYVAAVADGGALNGLVWGDENNGANFPVQINRPDNIPINTCNQVMAWLIGRPSLNFVELMSSAMAAGAVAMATQGQINNSKLRKVAQDITKGTNQPINLTVNANKRIFEVAGRQLTDMNAGEYFRAIQEVTDVPEALRIRLVAQQAKMSGLTSFAIITTAMSDYPDFNWPKIARLLPGQLEAYQAAAQIINNNPFYGFNKDLGPVSSTRYKSLTSVCHKLLLDSGAFSTLRDYMGVLRTYPNSEIIDKMITDFFRKRAENLDKTPTHQDIATAYGPVLQALGSNLLRIG